VLVCRHQKFVAAPVKSVWSLVGEPARHPEWWPDVVEVQGKQFGLGCSYCQVSHDGEHTSETTFVIARKEELRELLVRCDDTGLFMRWLLTDAQDGTFVDAEFGMDPARASDHEFDAEAAKHRLRQWLQTSLDGLAVAAALASQAEPATPGS
jgi:hypothetical protein